MKKIISGLVLSLAVVFAAGCGEKLAECDKATTAEVCHDPSNFKDKKVCMLRAKDENATDDKLKKDACLDEEAAKKVCTSTVLTGTDDTAKAADCAKSVEKIEKLKDKCKLNTGKTACEVTK